MKLVTRNGLLILEAEEDERVVTFQTPKTSVRPGSGPGVKGVVLHYTAVHAASRKPAALDRFSDLLDGQKHETVRELVESDGRIPPALALSLGNANRPRRKASWDVTVGKDGLVVQCNQLSPTNATWHAGRSLKDYRERYGRKDLSTSSGGLVYDGDAKAFTSPVFPGGEIMGSGNTFTVGIELESWGRVYKKRGRFCRRVKAAFKPVDLNADEVIKVGRRYYERISDAQYEALLKVARAYRDHFELPREAWFSHADIVPDRRVDPEPPLEMEAFVDDLYSDLDPLEEADQEAEDVEAEYGVEPTLFCEILDD